MDKVYIIYIINKFGDTITPIFPDEIDKLFQGKPNPIDHFYDNILSLLDKTKYSLRITQLDGCCGTPNPQYSYTKQEAQEFIVRFYSKEMQAYLALLLL